MRQLLQPIVSRFDELLRLMSAEPDSSLQLAYATCINHAMGFARYIHPLSSPASLCRSIGCGAVLKYVLNSNSDSKNSTKNFNGTNDGRLSPVLKDSHPYQMTLVCI